MVDIEKFSLLARIKLNSEEKNRFQKEFERILDYISQLKEVDVSGAGETKDSQVMELNDLKNIMREDAGAHATAEFSEDILKEAPTSEDGYIKVKHILK